ncbi:MAG: DUF6610 family protein [Nitrospirales bacterium]
MKVIKYVAHSKLVLDIAVKLGWFPAARYTNMRDVRTHQYDNVGFLDIDWKNYCFHQHLNVASEYKPKITIARDVECIFQLDRILKEAEMLGKHSEYVAIVPKDTRLNGRLSELIPREFILAYSVPTKYGGTQVSIDSFDRPVHLLGGRPEVQRNLANKLKVISFDCNRFTYDARFGDYFDGKYFKPHPAGGYKNCLEDSIKNINKIWKGYELNEKSKELIEAAV